jgi:inositol-phosphate transport system permease protein
MAVSNTLALKHKIQPDTPRRVFANILRNGLIIIIALTLVALLLIVLLKPLLASAQVEETVTTTLAQLLVLVLPYLVYISSGSTVREYVKTHLGQALGLALIGTLILYSIVTIGQFFFHIGPFVQASSLEMTLGPIENGSIVEALVPNGAAELAGIQVGDVITAVRRDPVDRNTLIQMISRAEPDTPLRLRILRNGEELQLTARTVLSVNVNTEALLSGLVVALIITIAAIFWPGNWTPYVLLIVILAPLMLGYLWLIIATFSYRTEGLIPLDGQNNLGGWTLANWDFLFGQDIVNLNVNIWQITLNSLIIALSMTALVLLISSMAGYALSRMNFKGRRAFLSFTLVLHGFPAVTLLIPIFFVLAYLGEMPLIGKIIGFNKPLGIALIMVAFELPLGTWLMKGYFDGIPWDIERSALIDGASRWRTYWEILLPQIRPGILALGVFSFIAGWNAFLVPQTYSIGTGTVNLPVFLSQLINETAATNWNQIAAVGLFQLIPVFVIFIFAQEYLLNIYAGGTKGSS